MNDLSMRAHKLRGYVSHGAELRSGKLSPRAYLEETLTRIAQLDNEIGAFVTINRDGAVSAADASAARWRNGKPLSPIDGMPVAIKDIIETADMPTGQGSPLWEGTDWQPRLGERPRVARGRRDHHRQDHHHRIRRHPSVAQDAEPARSQAHAGRLVERLGRRGRRRHGAGRTRHAGGRLDPAAVELLRRDRLQAERRRDQPQRLARPFQPELPGRDRRDAGRHLGGAARHRRSRRRRSGLRRADRRREFREADQAGDARRRSRPAAGARRPKARARRSPRQGSDCQGGHRAARAAPTIPTSRRSSRRSPTRSR